MSKELELRIATPESAFLRAVEFNFEELKQELEKALENYQGLVYTDENIPEGKADRAKLNKLSDSFNNERKRVKALCMQAYEPFENKIKILTSKVEYAKSGIDLQVKSFEERKKQAKQNEIEEHFNSVIGDLAEIVSLELIFNAKWLNAGYAIKNVTSEIDLKLETIKKDLETINSLKSEFSLQVKDNFLRTFDLGEALREKARLEEQKARLEAYEAQKVQQAPIEQKNAPIEVKIEAEPEAKTYDFTLRITGATKEQLKALKDCLDENKINHERI